jgi:hypothetical protein
MTAREMTAVMITLRRQVEEELALHKLHCIAR